jgi:hypothetical protein
MDDKPADIPAPAPNAGEGANLNLENALNAARIALDIGDDTAALYWVGQYYAAQAPHRAYAVMAHHAVNNVGMDGEIANKTMALALGASTWSVVKASFATRLASEDYKLVSQGIIPNERQIEQYHIDALASMGIARSYFGGAPFAALGASWLADATAAEDDGTHASGYASMSASEVAACATYVVMAGSSPLMKPRNWLYTAATLGHPVLRWMSGRAGAARQHTARTIGAVWGRLRRRPLARP